MGTFMSGQMEVILVPGMRMNVDTSIWTYHDKGLSIFSTNDFYKYKNDSIVSKKDGFKLYFECVFFPKPIDKEGVSVSGEKKWLNKFYEFKENGSYVLCFLIDSNAGVIISDSKKSDTWKNREDVRSLLESMKAVSCLEMDRLAGYPLPASASEDSLIKVRQHWLQGNLATYHEGMYVQPLCIIDKSIGFSFQRWYNYMVENKQYLYSDCELVLMEDYRRKPENMEWLSIFMDEDEIRLRSTARKNIKTKYELHEERDFGVNFIGVAEDHRAALIQVIDFEKRKISIALHHLSEGDCKTLDLTLDIPDTEVTQVPKKVYDEYSLELKHTHPEGKLVASLFDSQLQDFYIEKREYMSVEARSIKSLWPFYFMSRKSGVDEALEFEVPKNYSDWKGVLVTLSPDISDLEILNYALHSGFEEVAILPGGVNSESHFIGLNASETSWTEDTLDFLFRTSIFPGDFNHNGEIEYSVLYAYHGKIVYSVTYEKQEERYVRLKQDGKLVKEWMKSPIVSKLVRFSGMKARPFWFDMNDGFPEITWSGDKDLRMEYASEPAATNYDEQLKSFRTQVLKDAFNESEVTSKARFGDGVSNITDYFAPFLSTVASTGVTSEIVVYVDAVIDEKGRCYVINCESNAINTDAYIEAVRKGASKMTSWIPAVKNGNNVKQKVRFSVKCR
jgi:hypothetical protein